MSKTVLCLNDKDEDCQERTLEDFSCAQILQTCHLDGDSLEDHKKVYREKFKKFHPDIYPGKRELAEQASQALGRAKVLMKEEKGCFGQDEFGCEINENIISLTRTLRKPNRYLENLLGLSSFCTYDLNGNLFVKPIDACKNL